MMLKRLYSKVRPRVLDIMMSAFSEKTFSVCILSALTGFVHQVRSSLDEPVVFTCSEPVVCILYIPSLIFVRFTKSCTVQTTVEHNFRTSRMAYLSTTKYLRTSAALMW